MYDEQRPFGSPSFGQFSNFLELVVYGWILSLEVFLRHGFGSRYIGPQGATVLLLVPVYALCWQGFPVGTLFVFLFFFLVLCLSHRLNMFWRTRHGETTHSRYTGRSLLHGKRCPYSEVNVKKWGEPAFCLGIGLALCGQNCATLGVYVMIGAALMHWAVVREQYTLNMRSRDLNDALIDQEDVTGHFRQVRGEQDF